MGFSESQALGTVREVSVKCPLAVLRVTVIDPGLGWPGGKLPDPAVVPAVRRVQSIYRTRAWALLRPSGLGVSLSLSHMYTHIHTRSQKTVGQPPAETSLWL